MTEDKKRETGQQPESNLVYSSDLKSIVRLAREAGRSDLDIMKAILRGEFGTTHRKQLLLSWAPAFGREPKDILREAALHGLIPNAAMPAKRG
jgi:hypothetical protein